MAKIKLGIVADAGAPTGFATVTHNLTQYLLDTGEYDVEIIGINFDGRPNQWSEKFKIWPARLGGDLLGIGLVPEFITKVKPDVFFMFQDFWNIPMYLANVPDGHHKGLVTYYPVDAPNIKSKFMLPLAATAANICYTKFGVLESIRAANEAWDEVKVKARENKLDVVDEFGIQVNVANPMMGGFVQRNLKVYAQRLAHLRKEEGYHQIPHGVHLNEFKPLSSKKGARKALGLPTDGFYVGNVNRNQSRKRLDLTIRGFAEFQKTHSDAKLVLHCVKSDAQGWDLEQLGRYYGIPDNAILFTHKVFNDAMATIEQLNLLYNALDVQINTGGGEGWGLTAFEGAAAGIPQIVPDWSATKEIWEGHAQLLRAISVRHEPGEINTMQAVIDTNHLVELLSELHANPSLKEEIGKKCFEVTQRPEYTWEAVGKKFDTVFKSVIGKGPTRGPVAMSSKGQLSIQRSALQKI